MRGVYLFAATAFALSACGDSVEVGDDGDVAAQAMDVDIPRADYDRVEAVVTPEPGEPSDCNADLARPYIGQDVDAETRGELLSEVAPIVDVRWLAPGEVTTDDYDGRRLNVSFDENEIITGVRCG